MKQRFSSKKIIVLAGISLVVILMGIVYVLAGSKVGHEVPKTEVVQAVPDADAQPYTRPEATPPQQAEAVPQTMPQADSPAAAPAAAPIASEPSDGGKPKASPGLNKRLSKLISLLPGSRD